MPTVLALSLENHPGALAELLEEVAEKKINVIAIEAEAQGDFGSVRILTDDPAKAADVLRESGYDVIEAEAIVIEMPNEPGELAKIARKLADGDINVVSLFGSAPKVKGGKTQILLRVANSPKARKLLGVA